MGAAGEGRRRASESILDASAYARVVIRILPGDAPEIAAELKELRDRYEARLSRCFSAIPLPRERDATIARLALLGAMNWTPVWYHQGGKSVQAIARELLAPLRALAGVKRLAGPQMTAAALSPPARVLVTKIGLDGHDRGSRIVAAFLRDAGMEVIYTPPWQSIAAVVKLAMEEDVDVIGISLARHRPPDRAEADGGAARGRPRLRRRGRRRHRAGRRTPGAASRPACTRFSDPARRATRSSRRSPRSPPECAKRKTRN